MIVDRNTWHFCCESDFLYADQLNDLPPQTKNHISIWIWCQKNLPGEKNKTRQNTTTKREHCLPVYEVISSPLVLELGLLCQHLRENRILLAQEGSLAGAIINASDVETDHFARVALHIAHSS